MAPKPGARMKFYRNTATFASPTWVEITDIGDLSVADLAMGLAEFKRRGNNFAKNLATLIQSIAVEFRLFSGVGPANYTALVNAFFAGTAIEFAIYDDAIATVGAQGLRLPGILEQFPWDQGLENVAGHDVRIATAYMESPAGTERDPAWMVTAP